MALSFPMEFLPAVDPCFGPCPNSTGNCEKDKEFRHMNKAKRRFFAMAAGILIAPLIMVVAPGSASAHGYINSPASRQAQCAQNVVSCGGIKWEPQSVEGPKGLRNCHGDVGRFAELSDDSKGWQVASVGRTVTFNWTFTVRHRTASYEYYVGNTRIAYFDGGNVQPPPTVQHTVNMGSFTGRQKVLAIWNIGDTPMAFYSCVDLQVS